MLLLFMALLVGCSAPDSSLEALKACKTTQCQKEHLLPAWQADPAATTAYLQGLDDELVQAVLVGRLARKYPEQGKQFCAELETDGLAKAQCQRLVLRPHLLTDLPSIARINAEVSAFRQAPGPMGTNLPLPGVGLVSWDDVTPVQQQALVKGCDTDAICVQDRANSLALAGDLRGAGATCESRSGEQMVWECLFLAAEALVQTRGAAGLADGFRLCQPSGYGPFCVTHLIELASPPVPPADAMGMDAIDAARTAAQTIAQAGGEDQRLRALYAEFFWSIWLGTAYQAAEAVRGDIIPHLPPEALPHVRYSAAFRLFRHVDFSQGFHLDALVDHLRIVLADQRPIPAHASKSHPATTLFSRELWDQDRHEEGKIPAAFCRGATRRATADDPDLDLQLAVLEAIARLERAPPAAAFLALVGSPYPLLVRWTGARIGAALSPEAGTALAAAAPAGEERLVLARLLPRDLPSVPDHTQGTPPPSGAPSTTP